MSISKPKKIPNSPGIYIFRRGKIPLYIGKAASLKKRLASYFKNGLSEKVGRLLKESDRLELIETDSEVEALIKESEFIKIYIPKYNILLRDDKSFFYVGITKEQFPRIFITHKPRLGSIKNPKILNSKFLIHASYLGPFTSGAALKNTLRVLRSVFPYCSCKELHKRPCLNSEIGRCPGYCCLESGPKKHPHKPKFINMSEAEAEYRKNIKNIVAVLNGRKKKILHELKRDMREASNKEAYEKAAKFRDQIQGLENIFSHPLIFSERPMKRPLDWEKTQRNLQAIFGKKIERTEGYDISNISGTEATGSMVVFTEGKPTRQEYRMFSIKTVNQPNDVAMHQEVVRRRLNHPEWKFPDLMLIDGGKAQFNAIESLLTKEHRTDIALAALAKKEEELFIRGRKLPLFLKNLPPDTAFFFQYLRDESHRFAKKYHHKRREILFRREK